MNDADDAVIGQLIDELLIAGPRRICDSCKREFVSLVPKQMYCNDPMCQSRKHARKAYHDAIRDNVSDQERKRIAFVDIHGQWVWNVPDGVIHPFLVKFREWRRAMALERWIAKWYVHYPL